MPKWDRIMIHHSLTKDGSVVDWEAIRKYHVETEHWLDIGYHIGVEKMQNGLQAVLGRPLTMDGAHCKEQSMNSKAIGVCVMGNFDLAPPPAETLDFLVRLVIKPFMQLLGIKEIVFHRDYATYKSCPGKLFTKEMILSRLK